MKNCSNCTSFAANATKREGTGACVSPTSQHADRIVGVFGVCDSHEAIRPANRTEDAERAA